jgi:hypothetical protein
MLIKAPPQPIFSPASCIGSATNTIVTAKPIHSFLSPPESQAGSPPKTNLVKNILLQLQTFLESGQKVDGVTPALLEELKTHVIQNDQAGVWESLRYAYIN